MVLRPAIDLEWKLLRSGMNNQSIKDKQFVIGRGKRCHRDRWALPSGQGQATQALSSGHGQAVAAGEGRGGAAIGDI